jgi:hypothetical protein
MNFHPVRGARGSLEYVEGPPPAPKPRPLRVARMLAVAHALSGLLARPDGPTRGEMARALKMTEARLSQLLDLILLAPDIQEELLFLEVAPGRDPIPERALRYVVRALAWREQRRRFARLRDAAGCAAGGGAPPHAATPSRGRPATAARSRPRGSRSAVARPPR